MKLPNGSRYISKQHDVKHDGTNGHLLAEYEIHREEDYQNNPELFNKSFQSVIYKIGSPCMELAFHELHLKIILFFSFKFFTDKTFNYHDRIDKIQKPGRFLLSLISELSPHTAQLFSLQRTHPEKHGNHESRNQTDIHILKIHHDEGNSSIGKEGKNINEKVLNQPCKTFNTAVYSRLKFSGMVIFIRKIRNPVVQNLVYHRLRQHRTGIDSYFFTIKFLSEIDKNMHQLFTQKNGCNDDQHMNSFSHGIRKFHDLFHLVDGIFQYEWIYLCCECTDKSEA